jgi:glutamate synthase domain-containing protein 2
MHSRFIKAAAGTLLFIALVQFFWPPVLWALVIVVPLALVGVYDIFQPQHSIRRNFPLFGRGRWFMEAIRPYIRQYLVEADTDGAPINRMFRSVVYQRAKNELDTVPFGTRVDTYRTGYEWIGHSLAAIDVAKTDSDLRVSVGGPACLQPYQASILNISAMSFGALSQNALLALNSGAKRGGFSHNTGEGGISPYHLEHGGDLVWQIGTAYFGCRDAQGNFSDDAFREQAALASVRMIEIKLSQGAKPGHGGILPADKNTPEIARARGVEPGTQVNSPPGHSAFDSPLGLVRFVARLRALSGGKPIGFKLAIGRRSEFIAICKAMVETGIAPDFITVDGGEGGTGAAPLEYTNSVGMPLREALAFVDDSLTGFGLRQDIRIIASGTGGPTSERQWGTVREDYSADGDCLGLLPARPRPQPRLPLGRGRPGRHLRRQCSGSASRSRCGTARPDPQGAPVRPHGPEGNHGEDVKEYYFYLDATPTTRT